MRVMRYIIFFVALLVPYAVLHAESLKVSPAQFIVHDVEPGEAYDIYAKTGLRLSIYNDSDVARTWVLSTHRPSERGRWERGYGEIPDAKWCWFDKSEITVGPNSRGYAQLFLRIPKEEMYYNQHWVVTLSILGKSGTSFLGLGIDVRVQIETKSKSDSVLRPDGALGFSPSAVHFESITPGDVVDREVVVYNNDSKSHEYEVSALFDIEGIDKRSYLSKSYLVIPDSTWLVVPKKLKIAAGGVAAMNLRLEVPKDAAHLGKKWEHLVYIQPDEGRAEFVRVQVGTLAAEMQDTNKE